MKHYLYYTILFLFTSSACCMQHITKRAMTLDQKIGQLFMASAVADEDIAKDFLLKKIYRMDKEYLTHLITDYHIGGIIYLGKSDTEKQTQRTKDFQQISSIPLLIGQDLEPGRVGAARFSDWPFPSNAKLGEIDNTAFTYKQGFNIGKRCVELGVHMNFAPVADVNNNPKNPVINDRSFSDDPNIAAKNAILFAQGLHYAHVIACAKHFPGHGDTSVDSHYTLPFIRHDLKRLHAIELYPFKQLIAANIPAIMIGHLVVTALEPQDSLPATLSKKIVTDVLQKELGFTGLIITDALDMNAITKNYSPEDAALQALLAGNDILLCCPDIPAAIACIKQAVINNVITEQEIDAHVEKVLRIKEQFITN